MAQAAQIGGDTGEAEHYIREAKEIAEALNDEEVLLRVREFIISDRAERKLDPEAISELIILKHKYIQDGRKWDAGRVAIILSSVRIALTEYEQSAAEAEEAEKYFKDSSDTYGVDLARRNLASALAAIPEREGEANALIAKIHSESEEPDDGRMRAWLCNLLVRRFRSEGRMEEALGHADEAIKIGQQLGDQYLVAINEIGAGNVYRDMGRYQEAIDSYSNAGKSSQRCGRRDIEARASRLTATIYNRMAGDAERANVTKFARMAAQFARHAAGLLDSTAAVGERGRALEALGDALQIIGENTQAAQSYYGAAAAFREAAETDEFEAALMTASHIAVDADDLQTYLSGLRLAFGIPDIANDSSCSVIDELYDLTGQMILRLERSIAIPVFGFHFATMFSKVPPLVARHLFGRILDEFFSKTEGDQESWRLLFLSLVLCAAFKSTELRPYDLAQLSERISKKIDGLTYKPRPGGGGHWVLIPTCIDQNP
ncbi:MAG: tetratricopeptide repeat protein [Gemmatimonadetes bacterium]|nr:tetratricopeptide repeat protein [Gemmatimonadota bacterium]